MLLMDFCGKLALSDVHNSYEATEIFTRLAERYKEEAAALVFMRKFVHIAVSIFMRIEVRRIQEAREKAKANSRTVDRIHFISDHVGKQILIMHCISKIVKVRCHAFSQTVLDMLRPAQKQYMTLHETEDRPHKGMDRILQGIAKQQKISMSTSTFQKRHSAGVHAAPGGTQGAGKQKAQEDEHDDEDIFGPAVPEEEYRIGTPTETLEDEPTDLLGNTSPITLVTSRKKKSSRGGGDDDDSKPYWFTPASSYAQRELDKAKAKRKRLDDEKKKKEEEARKKKEKQYSIVRAQYLKKQEIYKKGRMEKVTVQKDLKKKMLSYHQSKGRNGKKIVGKDEDADAISNADKLKQLANAELYLEGMLLAQEQDTQKEYEERNGLGTWPWVGSQRGQASKRYERGAEQCKGNSPFTPFSLQHSIRTTMMTSSRSSAAFVSRCVRSLRTSQHRARKTRLRTRERAALRWTSPSG